MVEHTQTIRGMLRPNCLSVLNHFVTLTLKGLSRFRLKPIESEYKFRQNFQDTVNRLRLCIARIETIYHYLLHCLLFTEQITKVL